jgi:hypothetical protein
MSLCGTALFFCPRCFCFFPGCCIIIPRHVALDKAELPFEDITAGSKDMNLQNSDDLVHEAELLYQQRLKSQLERSHRDDFVSIEPVSGDYFLAPTLSEAIEAARKAHPDRLVHTVRVGHKVAVQLGMMK